MKFLFFWKNKKNDFKILWNNYCFCNLTAFTLVACSVELRGNKRARLLWRVPACFSGLVLLFFFFIPFMAEVWSTTEHLLRFGASVLAC